MQQVRSPANILKLQYSIALNCTYNFPSGRDLYTFRTEGLYTFRMEVTHSVYMEARSVSSETEAELSRTIIDLGLKRVVRP